MNVKFKNPLSFKVVENAGAIMTDNSPNFSYINQYTKDLNTVKEAFKQNPETVKFYANFTYVGYNCYNGIRKEDIIESN